MKIFNWVNRRILHNVHPSTTVSLHQGDGFGEKAESNEAETKALLKHAGLIDAIDGWKDGILTIGTFGLDPIKHFNKNKETEEVEEEEEEEDSLDESLWFDPLAFTPYRSDNSIGSKIEKKTDHLTMIHRNNNINEDEISLMTTPLVGVSVGLPIPITPDPDWNKRNNNGPKRVKEKEKGDQRTTLADLFLADSDESSESDSDSVMTTKRKQQATTTHWDNKGVKQKHHPESAAKENPAGISFAKKLIPLVKEGNSRPIWKLHRMMKKMLRRKIHPELEAKVGKSSDEELHPYIDHEVGATERITLL